MTHNTAPTISGYTIHEVLGAGGMATVYLATQHSLQRQVAIKVLEANQEAQLYQRFINEAHIVASLHHPAIISIYDVQQLADGRCYLVMELIKGGDLSQCKGQKLEPKRALAIIKQIAQGLAVVHHKGLIHRDIKPANILFRDHEHIVITDFGIAKNTQINQELTQHGVVVGSPSYSSPEQAQCQEIDHRSDLYSVGVIFVEMLLGYNPYRGENYTQTVVNHVQMDIPTLPQELSPYQAIVNKLLAKQPDQRFSDSQSLVNAIDGLLTVSIPIYSPTVSTQKKSVSKQKVIVGVVAILLFLLALITAPMVKKYWQVRQFLQQAEQRLQQKKWLSPANDSAQFFYQQALNLDADNQQAKTGLTTAKNQQIAYWLTQAETKFASGDLSTPKDDNAVFYFQQIQTIDAKQPQAQAGLQRIAQVYLGLAQEDYQQKQFEQALNAIKLGLLAQPNHSELLKLAAEHEQRVAAANQKSTKTSPQNSEKKPSKNKQSSNNGLQKFWKKLWGN